MDLVDYLIALDAGGGHPGPDKLVLPQEFVTELGKLYTAAEARGREHGCVLFCDRASRTLAYGEIAEGLPTSMNIPVSTHVDNFGDVHAHPSASIGHAGGHSAHSMSDLAKFSGTVARTYFIQFVVAGPRIYAMAQIAGVSTWNASVTAFLSARHLEEQQEMRSAVIAAAGGPDDFLAGEAALGKDPAPEDHQAMMTELKNIGKVGKLMQTLSIQNCTTFARTFRYVFFAGDGTFLTRTS